MDSVAKSAVMMVAHFKPVFVIGPGTVGRTLHITKLDFVNAVFGVNIHRETGFEQAVQLFPVDLRIKVQPCALRLQADVLHERRITDPAAHLQHAL